MISLGNNNIIAMYINGLNILSVYTLGLLVWQLKLMIDDILSCYYNGYWIDEYPWTDDTPWTD